MSKASYYARMALGCVCYALIMSVWPWRSNSRLFLWALSWAGFYAHADGYENYCSRAAALSTAIAGHHMEDNLNMVSAGGKEGEEDA